MVGGERGRGLVDARDEQREDGAVDGLDHGVARAGGLLRVRARVRVRVRVGARARVRVRVRVGVRVTARVRRLYS